VTTDPTSTDGQPLGERGLRTRQRILESVAACIETQGLRGLRLADVAEEVGFSPPAFYQYFNDLDEAILALCEEVGHSIPAFPVPETGWNGPPDSPERTREFVARFFEYWDQHRAVLWSRNVAVIAGDDRFQDVRNDAFKPMVDALRAEIEAAQREGRVDRSVSPRALGASLTVMLDRMAMLTPQLVEYWGTDDEDDVVDAVAYIFDGVLGIESGRSATKRRPTAASGRTKSRRRA